MHVSDDVCKHKYNFVGTYIYDAIWYVSINAYTWNQIRITHTSRHIDKDCGVRERTGSGYDDSMKTSTCLDRWVHMYIYTYTSKFIYVYMYVIVYVYVGILMTQEGYSHEEIGRTKYHY